MRLIIDIPEEEYNSGTLVNYFGCYSEKLDEVIYNAPTVEMAEDCVKREDAQDIMARLLSDYLHDEDREKIENANAEIGELPSVQPQPKRGKWIEDEEEMYCICSVCGTENWNVPLGNFCLSCGADMREVQTDAASD